MKNILFVCTGNICRSPTAEGVLRHKLAQAGMADVEVDSAGTQGYHAGEPPDPRSIAAAKKRGVDIGAIRSRRVAMEDFTQFDLILGLDHGHVELLRNRSPKSSAPIELFLEYAGYDCDKEPYDKDGGKKDVPDPYYGSTEDFEHALDLIEAGCDALIKKLQNNRG